MVIIIIRMIIMIIFMCKNYETRYVNDHFRSHLFFSPVSSRRSTTSPDTSGNFPPPHFSSVCVNLSLSYSLYGPSAGFLVFLDWNHSFFSPVTCYITALSFFDWPWVFLKSDFSSLFYLFIPTEEKILIFV